MTDARNITHALRGRWCGSYGIALCPAHNNHRTPALSISDGDEGRLLVKCHAGCTGGDVLRAIRDLGLGSNWRPGPAAAARRKVVDEAARTKRTRQALGIWREARPVENTLVEHYLRSRGITCPLPATLRYHSGCWHGEKAQRLPAMVAAVGTSQRIVAVHRTYLTPEGKKISGPGAKMTLGPAGGGAVRLDARSRCTGQRWPHSYACELDAIPPHDLRALVKGAIEQHLPADELARLLQIEDLERETMVQFLSTWDVAS